MKRLEYKHWVADSLLILVVTVQLSITTCPGKQDGRLSSFTIQRFRIVSTIVTKTSNDPTGDCAWSFIVYLPEKQRPLTACLVPDGGKIAQIQETELHAYGPGFKELRKKLKLNSLAPFLYTGFLLNDKDSWIFGTINKGGFLGQIYTQSRIFYIEKSLKYIKKSRLHQVLKFRNDEAVKLTNVIYDEKDLKEICSSGKQKRHAHNRHHRKYDDDDDGDEADDYFNNNDEEDRPKHHAHPIHHRKHQQELHNAHHRRHSSPELYEQPKHFQNQPPPEPSITKLFSLLPPTQNVEIPSENAASTVASTENLSQSAEDLKTQQQLIVDEINSIPAAPQEIIAPVLQTEKLNGEEPMIMKADNVEAVLQLPDVPSETVLNYNENTPIIIQDTTTQINLLEEKRADNNNYGIYMVPPEADKLPEILSIPPESPSIVNYNSDMNQYLPISNQNDVVENPNLAIDRQQSNNRLLPPSANIDNNYQDNIIQPAVPAPPAPAHVDISNDNNITSNNGYPSVFPEGGYTISISDFDQVETVSISAKRYPTLLLNDLSQTLTFAVVADNMFYQKVGDASIVITVARILYFLDRVEWVFRSTAWRRNGLPDNVGFNIEQLAIELDQGKVNSARSFEEVVKRLGKMTIGLSAKISAKDITVSSTYDSNNPSNVLVLVIVTVVDSDGKELSDIIIIQRILKAVLRAVGFADTSRTFSPDCDSTGTESAKTSFLLQNLEITDCFQRRIQPFLYKITSKSKLSVAFCGNGILEKGEQCDCGYLKQCMKLGKPCCNPRGNFGKQCKFTSSSQCYDPLGICCNSTTCSMLDMLDEGLSCNVQTCNSGGSSDQTMSVISVRERPLCGALLPEVNPHVQTNCYQDRCQSDECSRLDLSECTCSQPNLHQHCSTCCFLPAEESCVSSDLAAEKIVNNIRSTFMSWKLKSDFNNNQFHEFIKSDPPSNNIWTSLTSDINTQHKPMEAAVDKRIFSKEYCIDDACININFLHWKAGGPCVIHGVVSYCDSNFVCIPNYQMVASKDERFGRGMLLDGNYTLSDTDTDSGSSTTKIFPYYLVPLIYIKGIFCTQF